MKEIKPITYNELMRTLDLYRRGKGGSHKITEEQKRFLIACREGKYPISFEKMAVLWSKLWKPIGACMVRKKYLQVKSGHTI